MTPPEWVLLARIVRPQGRRGEVLAELFTDFPEEFSRRKRIFLRGADGSTLREARVESHWPHKGRIVLKFAEVDSMNSAEELRNVEVVVPLAERIPLEDDSVYVSDLLGMHVIDTREGTNVDAGEIIDVEPEGSGPAMLVIRGADGGELLIPFVRAYLKKVDMETGRLEMELPEGLLAAQRPD
jgi:16S rRNA processing protein RimM